MMPKVEAASILGLSSSTDCTVNDPKALKRLGSMCIHGCAWSRKLWNQVLSNTVLYINTHKMVFILGFPRRIFRHMSWMYRCLSLEDFFYLNFLYSTGFRNIRLIRDKINITILYDFLQRLVPCTSYSSICYF